MTNQEFLTRITKRDDARWAHPELQESYYTSGFESSADILYDLNVDYDIRHKMADMAVQFIPDMGGDKSRVRTFEIPGCPEEPDAKVNVSIAYPLEEQEVYPVYLKICPGGLIISTPDMFPLDIVADQFGAVAVSFQYRTLFNGTGHYPDNINDCHAVYKYLVDHAEELKIDPDRIVIEGGSTGGHLALALCHRLKRYGYTPRGCLASVPVIDDRLLYESSKLHGHGWVGTSVDASSRSWLSGVEEAAAASPESFANHATIEDCIGLPPTFIVTCEEDPCSDPCMEYATKLKAAGVYTELHIWGGTNHAGVSTAASSDPEHVYGARYQRVLDTSVQMMIKYDLRRHFLDEVRPKEEN